MFSVYADYQRANNMSNDNLVLKKPSLSWMGVITALALWALYGMLLTIVISASMEVSVQYLLPGQAISTLVLAVYSLPVWWIMIREMDAANWWWKLLAHISLGPLYAWAVLRTSEALVGTFVGDFAAASFAENAIWIFVSNLTIYAVQFGIFHTLRAREAERIRSTQARAMRNLAERQELSALRAQMNPHFLFNALNSISARVNSSPNEAREMIVMLSKMMRYTLHSSEREVASLGEELQFAENYLELEHKRFVGRICSEYDVAPNILNASLPVITLQPLVENAIHHGLGSLDTPGTVSVRAYVEDNDLHICVSDTGLGTAVAPDVLLKQGTGLSTTNERLQRHYGAHRGLSIDTAPGKGFRVSFSIPYTILPPSSWSTIQEDELPFLNNS
jgi:two-component system, LytTR family, sensor kinase